MNTHDTQNPRPIGYWIKAVDRLMAAAFATAFDNEGASRRDWRLLNAVDSTAPATGPLHPGKLRELVERGWVVEDGEGWTLTDEGRAAKERLGAIVDGIRAQIADAVSPEDFDTTVATLEQIALTLGWDENTPLPRGHRGRRGRRGADRGFGAHDGEASGFAARDGFRFGRRHGFGPGLRHGSGPGFGHGFGPGFGHGFDHGFEGPDTHECRHPHAHGEGHAHAQGHPSDREHAPRFGHGHGHHDHRGGAHGFDPHHRTAHGGGRRAAQAAFERGFDAGYSRGRTA